MLYNVDIFIAIQSVLKVGKQIEHSMYYSILKFYAER